MLSVDFQPHPQPSAPSDGSLHASPRLIPRLAGAVLALLFFFAVGACVLTWSRTTTLRDVAYPALTDFRQLDALLVATHDALRGDHPSAIARADSLADEFHRVAEASQRRSPLSEAALAADGEFRAYYAQARHRTSDAGATPASDGLSEITYRALRAQLGAITTTQRQTIEDGYASLRRILVVSGMSIALAALLAFALILNLTRDAARAGAEPVTDAARRAESIAEGDLDVELRTEAPGAEGALHRALARIAATARANRTAAEELAAGEYRIGTHENVPDDRTGRALARVSAYLDYLSIAAQRIAEGDLTASIEPRSPDDTLGHAHAMMLQRVVSALCGAAATAQLVAATAAEVQRGAAALALATAPDGNTPARSLAESADALVGQAQRLETTLAHFHGCAEQAGLDDRPAARRLTLHKSPPQSRARMRKMAIV